MKQETPAESITVIVPVYNGAPFIIDTLSSIEKQTYLPCEIIIVNDGSTDNTKALIEKFAHDCVIPVRVITKENGGLSSARNTGITASTTPFIAFLDADDIWLPNKLAQQIAKYQSSELKNIGLLYCRNEFIDTTGVKDKKAVIIPLNKNLRGNSYPLILKANEVLSSGSGVLVKKSVFDDVGVFDENLKYAEDWDMWIRIAQKFEIEYVDEVLVYLRSHPTSMSKNKYAGLVGEIEFFNKWFFLLENKKEFPKTWPDMLIGRALKRFPGLDFFKIIKKRLHPDIYYSFFKGTIVLYITFFLVRKMISKIKKLLRIFYSFFKKNDK